MAVAISSSSTRRPAPSSSIVMAEHAEAADRRVAPPVHLARRRREAAPGVGPAMADLETGLRALIAEIVRKELPAALADIATPDEYLSTHAAAELAHVAGGTIRRWI